MWNEVSAGIVGPMPKPKKYMDPRAHSASIAEMARQMAQQRKEVGFFVVNTKLQEPSKLCCLDFVI